MTLRKPISTLVSLLALAGCEDEAPPPAPTAAEATPEVPAAEPARAVEVREVADVTVVASFDAWAGELAVPEAVTPVRLRVENEGRLSVLVQYESMSLVAADGTTHSAIPPFELEGDLEKRRAVAVPDTSPRWTSEGFFVTHAYDPLFDDAFEVWKEEVYSDPRHYDYYHSHWSGEEMPTANMLSLALPEGVIDEGGFVQGFVYFEKLDGDEPVTFRMQLRSASGYRFGSIQLPFVPEAKP